MKKVYFILFVCFEILTFAGAIFVLSNRGQTVGYAVVPMLFALTFGSLYRREKHKM